MTTLLAVGPDNKSVKNKMLKKNQLKLHTQYDNNAKIRRQ